MQTLFPLEAQVDSPARGFYLNIQTNLAASPQTSCHRLINSIKKTQVP